MTAMTLDAMRETLFCALLSDVLDGFGYRDQALPPTIRPLDEELVMCGRARTGLFMDVYAPPLKAENPYALEIELIDSLKPGEVPVFACGKTGRIGPWGGLLSTAAMVRGAAGALMDGLVRDIREIRAMKFPVFHAGIGPLDSKGRGILAQIDVPIECGSVRVAPGDLVFGDADGCVVVPQAIEAEVIQAARERLKGERGTMAALRAGRTLGEVFAEYGVL